MMIFCSAWIFCVTRVFKNKKEKECNLYIHMAMICRTIYLDKQMSLFKRYYRWRIPRIVNLPSRPSPGVNHPASLRRRASFQISSFSAAADTILSPLTVAFLSSSEINARVNQNPRRAARRIFHGLTVLPPLRSVAALTTDSDKTTRYYPAAAVF